jgi:signal peptidase II
VYIFRTKQMGTLQLVGAVSLIAGGASNLVDRFLYDGRVVDFLNFGIGNLRTGILNIADLSIVGGVIVLFFTMKPEPPKSTDSPKS